MVFARLHYPEHLVENTIRHFIEMKGTENVCSKQQGSDQRDARIRIVIPFKDQKSANAVQHQLDDRSRKIDVRRSKDNSNQTEEQKPPIVNQQNVVYSAGMSAS